MTIDLKEIKSQFDRIEKELNLFELNICGVKIWAHIRPYLFALILEKLNIIGNVSSGDIDQSLYGILKKIIRTIKNIFYKKEAMIGKKKKTEVLIFSFPRKKRIDNENWDIFTDFLLKDVNFQYQVIEQLYDDVKIPKIKDTLYLNYFYGLGFLLEKFIKVEFTKEDIMKLNKVNERINQDFNIKINFIKEVKKKIKFRYSYNKVLEKLIDFYQPKLIIYVFNNIQVLMLMNEMCKKKGIPTIEFQHGAINPIQLAYNFPKNVKPDVLPDYFFTFGKYWEEVLQLPFPKSNIKTVGFPYFEHEFNKYQNQNKQNKILFISSPTIGFELCKFAKEFVDITDKRIYIKLHPKEYKRWKKEYNINMNPKIIVIDNDEEFPLYKLFSEAKTIIGVNSTAIFESMMFNKPIFIIKLTEWEFFEEFINQGIMELINSPIELNERIENLNKSERSPINVDYYFKKYAIQNQKEEIRKILESINQ
ncbi:hypothetical protein DSAG12_01851 [Promethearchaeum syntrophicum]|uniref:Uncharacterized protein n=1 Tax=Promethearchaeum syntrophicum TaxID=2594042 RepID=A0A5B9DA88_9ARCH|nr:hypothetical protein [Candidatus Prometheoarchaeum syntrophicum]QEE16023.1 Capsule polysaccharide biosynthesis protein [Candidatus Prometheoarchaeum syntrophicum]